MTINLSNKTAFLFSGQSSQYQGMGKELLDSFPELSYIYDTGSDILDFDLKKICFDTDLETLSQTEFAQPAILATSILAYQAVLKLGITPSMVAGHSLGEYAAMVCSSMLSLEDGFRVIKARAKAMGECAKSQNSAMCAVIGITESEVSALCESVEGYVIPVNFNSPVQTVIAGEVNAVESVMRICAEKKIRAVRLNVSAAFHSKLMLPAAQQFVAQIKDIPFSPPTVDFYSNLYGDTLQTPPCDMVEYLGKHLVSPVLFTKELNAMHENGAYQFIECGPGKVLTGLVKKTLTGVCAFNVENEKTFLKLKAEMSENNM